jgi:adenosylhomocysteine nucleosidase
MSAPVLVLAALPAELAPLARRLRLAGGPDGVRRGAHRRLAVVAATSGIGPERSALRARELADAHRPAAAITMGIAGALTPELRVGDVLIPGEVVDDTSGASFRPTLAPRGLATARSARDAIARRLVSVASPALTRAAKAELRGRRSADAVDMESARAAATWAGRDIPWLCVRAISDDADTELPLEALRLTDASGRVRAAATAAYVLRHPGRLPGLLRLGRDTSRAVAAATDRVVEILDAIAAGYG